MTFVDWEDMSRWKLIDKAIGLGTPEPVETYSSSPHLFEDLNIPAGTKGRLPRHKRSKEGLGAEAIEDLGGPDSRKPRSAPRSDSGGGSGQGRSRSRSRNRRSSSAEAQGGGAAESAPSSEGGSSAGRPRRRRRRRVSGSSDS